MKMISQSFEYALCPELVWKFDRSLFVNVGLGLGLSRVPFVFGEALTPDSVEAGLVGRSAVVFEVMGASDLGGGGIANRRGHFRRGLFKLNRGG